MNIRHFLFGCLSVLGLASCEKNNVTEPDEFPAASVFQIVSSVRASRAPQLDENGAGKFTDGDQNSVFLHTAAGKNLHQLTYTYGNRYLWTDFGLSEASCKVSACYPVVTTSTPENFAWDVQKQSTSDFLLAAPAEADTHSSDPVNLSFYHAMHRLAVTLKAESAGISEEMLADAEISCRNFYPVANLNLLEGKPAGASGYLASLKSKGKKGVFILPAQPVADIELVIKIGGREKVYRLASCQVDGKPLAELEFGKSFALNIGVDEEHIFILGQNINGWTDQGSADGNISI